MRRYNIATVILLIIPIINFTVAAPALAPGDLQEGIDVVHSGRYGDAITTLVKRGNEWNELWGQILGSKIFAKPDKSHFAKPSQGPSPARLSWIWKLSGPGPASGWTDVTQPLATIPEEPEPLPKLTSKLAKK